MLLDCIYRPQETNHNIVWAGWGKHEGEGDKTSGYQWKMEHKVRVC